MFFQNSCRREAAEWSDFMQQQQSSTYDYRQYDRVWQRVCPTLDPYPGVTPECGAESAPAVSPAVPEETRPTPGADLAGAAASPCCMGAPAMGLLRVLQGWIEEELAAKRYYLAFARQAPAWARQALRGMAEDKEAHARRLMAVHYLITCQCYQPSTAHKQIYVGQLCPALRERYLEETCSAQQYARAAESTGDPCLEKLLLELSEDTYRHGERLLALLERAMRQQQ